MRVFTQAPFRRPASYRLSRRFATIPSSPCDLTAEIIFSALAAKLSEKRIAGIFGIAFVRSNSRRFSSGRVRKSFPFHIGMSNA
jgi:hypothetical protein